MLEGKEMPMESKQNHGKCNRLSCRLIFIQYYIKQNIAYYLETTTEKTGIAFGKHDIFGAVIQNVISSK